MKSVSLMIAVFALGGFPSVLTAQVGKIDTIPPKGKINTPEEIWEAAFIKGPRGEVKIGYVHTYTTSQMLGKEEVFNTVKELRFEILREGNRVEMKADSRSTETATGKVLKVGGKIWLSRDQFVELQGVVSDDRSTITLSKTGTVQNEQKFRWREECIGVLGESQLLQKKKIKLDDEFSYTYFEPQIGNYATVKVKANKLDKIRIGMTERELLLVTATPDPIKVPGLEKPLQLPPLVIWIDPETRETIRSEMNIAELGNIVLVRTTKVAATAPNGNTPPDIMTKNSIYLKESVPGIYDAKKMVYRITFQGDVKPNELLTVDARQEVRNVKKDSFELVVTAKRFPVKAIKEETVSEDYLKSNWMINSKDNEVIALARKAVGNEKDPFKKAQLIEKFVRRFMTETGFSEAMATADHVARTGRGDCTEFAVLAAAMCRAEGIPSRTALGLVYVEQPGQKPFLGHHMWFEVFVEGQWIMLDATLAKGSVGPSHIKISDHSWAGVLSFTPLLPVKGFIMANPTIEILKE